MQTSLFLRTMPKFWSNVCCGKPDTLTEPLARAVSLIDNRIMVVVDVVVAPVVFSQVLMACPAALRVSCLDDSFHPSESWSKLKTEKKQSETNELKNKFDWSFTWNDLDECWAVSIHPPGFSWSIRLQTSCSSVIVSTFLTFLPCLMLHVHQKHLGQLLSSLGAGDRVSGTNPVHHGCPVYTSIILQRLWEQLR